MNEPEIKVAIISSLTGGLGHYCAHLARPLSQHVITKFITYPQLDLSGTVVKEIIDTFVKHYIKWPRFDLDETNPGSIVEIAHYLHEKEIPLVNVHVATTVKQKILYFTSFILYCKKVYGTKFVFTIHDVLPFEENGETTKLLEMFYSLGDGFIVGNVEEKQKLMKYFHIQDGKIHVIHHGIYDLFDRKRYTPESARAYLDIAPDKKVILFFGWLRPYKGFDTLIEAAHILKEKRDDFLVYVVSGLKYIDKPIVANYRNMIQTLGLKNDFFLNLNYVGSNDIEASLKASDILVLPYLNSSQSGVLMMAAGFKKPVVITDVLSDKTWVDNKAGYVVKPKDAQELAEKIHDLFENPLRAREFGEYNYTYAKEHFSWEKVAQEYLEAYKKALR